MARFALAIDLPDDYDLTVATEDPDVVAQEILRGVFHDCDLVYHSASLLTEKTHRLDADLQPGRHPRSAIEAIVAIVAVDSIDMGDHYPEPRKRAWVLDEELAPPAPPIFTIDRTVLGELLDELDLDEYGSTEKPGKVVEELVLACDDAITAPGDGYSIGIDLLTFDSDPDMILVRVFRPDGRACLSTYAQDWDDFAPRVLAEGAELTADMVREVLVAVVADANQALARA